MEVIIALAIISVCAALTMVIYLNIQKNTKVFFKLKADEIAENTMLNILESGNLTEDTQKAEEFTVKQSVAQHPNLQDCLLIRVLVFDGEKKKLTELESVVYKPY